MVGLYTIGLPILASSQTGQKIIAATSSTLAGYKKPDGTNTVTGLNEVGFSNRLMEDIPLPIDQAQSLLLFWMLSRKDGVPFIQKIAHDYFDTIKHSITALAQAGAGNMITAYGHSLIISNMLEHNYMIHQGATRGLADALNWLVASEEGKSWFTAIFGGGGFAVPKMLSFSQPQKTIQAGALTEGAEE